MLVQAPFASASVRALRKEAQMIKVHHLNNSRSHRVLWMLEELGVPYDIVACKRAIEKGGPLELIRR